MGMNLLALQARFKPCLLYTSISATYLLFTFCLHIFSSYQILCSSNHREIVLAMVISTTPTTDWNKPIAVALANWLFSIPARYTNVEITSQVSFTSVLPMMKGLSKPMLIICLLYTSSFNYIGSRWAGGCKELLQNVLRGEWGFLGFVETDYFGVYGYMTADQGVRNGSDLMLCTTGNDFNKMTVLTNSSKQAMRTSAKNILYTVVNSRAYEAENLNPGMAKWKVILIGADVVAALLIVGLEYTAIKNYKKRKEEEEEV